MATVSQAIDLTRARRNMVENQVRPWEVLDARVLSVLTELPRESFVLPAYRALAYADLALPIAHGEIMMKPTIEGRVLQSLDIQPNEEVLEIGTGSGYLTACLAKLGQRVTSVEQHADFVETARARLSHASIGNVELVHADALVDFNPGRLFDAIAVTGAVAQVPPRFHDWLKVGGRMFVVVGVEPAMRALLLRREADGAFSDERLFETDLPHLAGAQPRRQFSL
ncbi:MAG TPA: protein-L-isoaspartate O-methyltransferase [Rhodanobacteraceae bacterium]|nr:protein-L-isoaspartate O-methyltransferase [Rhodanobacteraceae bacterium]